MDTRDTKANLKSVSNIYQTSKFKLKNKVYFNSVLHWMDDFDRSEDEILNRIAMPGMFMPMYGETRTVGFVSKNNFYFNKSLINIQLDLYNMFAFADMDMKSLNPNNADMYLINLAGINSTNAELTFSFNSSSNYLNYYLNANI